MPMVSRLPVLAGIAALAIAAPVASQQTPVPPVTSGESASALPPPPGVVADEPLAIAPADPEPAQMWRVTSTTTINGLAPAVATTDICINDADLERPPAELGGLKCNARDFQISGNTLTWTGTCGQASGSGTLVFADDRKAFNGSIVATQGALRSTMQIQARSTGACVK